jgi:hypothetical protein
MQKPLSYALILEVPIIFTDQNKGESKMSNSIIRSCIFGGFPTTKKK